MRLTSVKRALPLVRMLRHAAARAELTATIVGDGPERVPCSGIFAGTSSVVGSG